MQALTKYTQAYFGNCRMLRIGFVFDEPLKTPTYSTKFNTQEYRSGHNEAVLKTVRPKATGVRIPLPAPIKMVYSLRVDLFLLPQSEGTNPKGSHTAGTEQTSRNRLTAVSASRGDVGLNLYLSGTISTNLAPSSIPLFKRGF